MLVDVRCTVCVPTAVTTSTPVVVNGRTGTHVLVWPDLFDLAARVVGFADAESSVVDIRAQLLTIPSGATEMVAVWNSDPTYPSTWNGELALVRDSPLACARAYWWRVLVTNRAGLVAVHTSEEFYGDVTQSVETSAAIEMVAVSWCCVL